MIRICCFDTMLKVKMAVTNEAFRIIRDLCSAPLAFSDAYNYLSGMEKDVVASL